MSVRNFAPLFRPKSVALIGAGRTPGTVGATLARNLIGAGFAGPVWPVNPKHREIEGMPAFPDIASLPQAPDLAVIATPPGTVPGLIAQLGARGTRAAVVITAGFGEGGDEKGAGLCQAMLEAARPYLLRIVGPNCVGLVLPHLKFNASFLYGAAAPGNLAFVTQSGALLAAVLDWTAARGIGFSHLVSLGDMADVDFGDMLDWLGGEVNARAILLYVESITHARKFMSAARAAARLKPVVVVKGGRGSGGARAAASHTGALAGSDAVYDAAFRRAGMLRVRELADLFDAAETLAYARPQEGDRLAIVTNGGGLGVLAADALGEAGGRLAALAAATIARLDGVLPRTWSHGNPVDIVGDADPARYAAAVEAVLDDPDSDAVLVLNVPTAISAPTEAARAVIGAAARESARPDQEPRAGIRPRAGRRRHNVLTSWVGGQAPLGARALFAAAKIPTYDTPDQAVRSFMRLVDYRRNQALLMETPPALHDGKPPEVARARAVVAKALDEGREWLDEAEAKEVVRCFGVPVVATVVAADPASVATEAARLAVPVAVKIRSPDIVHKTDVGGVSLNLKSPEDARRAAEAMLAAVRAKRPAARLAGFTVQPMAQRPGAHELILGIVDDAQFGPVVLFGHGGTAVEVIADKALALPPLNALLARRAMEATRVFKLLQGYRGRNAADLDAVAASMVRVAQIAIELPEVSELDINPLWADDKGVLALDARLRVRRPARPGAARLAIRPYPAELEEDVTDRAGNRYRLRPIRPEDEPALRHAFTKLTPRAVRMRFFAAMKQLDHGFAARLTQIDYDREMALVLAAPRGEPPSELFGVVRIAADPDNLRGEFAVTVRSDRAGQGLGWLLMERILGYARRRGIGEVHGQILAENTTMLKMCREMGFAIAPVQEDPGILEARLKL